MNTLEQILTVNTVLGNQKTGLQIIANSLLEDIKNFIASVEVYLFTNELWFIDWENEINKLSIKDHNENVSSYKNRNS